MTHPDQHSFATVVDSCLDDVYAYVAFRLAPDRGPVEDIVQEVFAAATRGWQTLTASESAKAWLLQIARHKIADHFRQQSRQPPQQRLAMICDEAHIIRDVGDSSDGRARATRVSLALRSLPTTQSELLEDKYMLGLGVRAIANNRGMSEKAVESALTRAREAFRQAFNESERHQESVQ